MVVKDLEDPGAFLETASSLLLADEARNNLILGIAGTLCHHPSVYDEYRLWLVEDGGQIVGAALQTPPYNLVLHTAPLKEQVDATYHWHWEIHPRLREIAGLELGTGLPVNPVSPEDAVEELRSGPVDDGPQEHPRR